MNNISPTALVRIGVGALIAIISSTIISQTPLFGLIGVGIGVGVAVWGCLDL